MEEQHIYQKIVAAIRQEVLAGQLRPGERLPTVRQAAADWAAPLALSSAPMPSWPTRAGGQPFWSGYPCGRKAC